MKRLKVLSLGIAASAALLSGPALAKPQVGDIVAGLYICTFKSGTTGLQSQAAAAAREAGGRVTHVYSRLFSGFALRASAAGKDRMVMNRAQVSSCVAARWVGLPEGESQTTARFNPGRPGGGDGGGGGGGGGGGKPDKGGSSETVPWGVAKVGVGTASSATVWVLDTGIDMDNPDLTVSPSTANGGLSTSFLTSDTLGGLASGPFNVPDDYNGHGTHVAGTIGAKQNGIDVVGVAPGVQLVSVRVLDSVGVAPDAVVLDGLDYIAAKAGIGDVVNMSLSADPGSTILNAAVLNLANSGVYVVVAAGNDSIDVDASAVSPANQNASMLYTVSAIDKRDRMASFSNYGLSVDYAEPGVGIVSLAIGGGTAKKDGTSMAAPHLSGILATTGNGNVGDGGLIKGDKDGNPDTIGVLP
ncbi:S8 family serine peptidase [Croceicoccus sediminis]|uniref:S8 family serine peptidase n=1 Tax=Croceicoccus sediminis TaxID=2571150 RepID=UPI0011841231|nr:S8 family serine peptidase [Croceicoccus sediminis]